MKWLKNLKIKSKLRIPIILLFILLLVFLYFYFNADSLIKDELKGKTTITETGNKTRTLFYSIMGYLDQTKSHQQLNADYQELVQLVEKEDIFDDQVKKELTGLEAEFNTIEAIFKENARIEKQVFELADSYIQQSNEFLAGSGGPRQDVSNLAHKVINIKALFLQAKYQEENGPKLVEFLDQTLKDAENEELRLANTPVAQLPQMVKETIVKTKEVAAKLIENSKSFNQSKENIANIYNRLLEQIHQIETGKTNIIAGAVKNTFFKLLIVILVVLLLSIILIIAIGKLITNPIRAMTERAYDLAVDEVDMTKRLEVDSKDEIGELSGWFNKFLERLHLLILKVKNSSDEVSNATQEITTGSENLAARTNEQAVSITQTSATLEKFSESIRQNTENSAEADMMLVDFNQGIQEKSSLIDNVTSTMTEIYESSKQIDNIIKVINDISFQTNLLALNAAVEAARAGEAGRGFAVVASEVRNLAQKTAESSKSIQNIVLRNVESTQKGMQLVKDTSEFFGEIVGVMGEIVEKVSNITEVSRQQADNIEQITETIGQMDQVANRNAQLVGELSETGKKVKNNAIELQDLVIQFKFDESHVPAAKQIKVTAPPKPKPKEGKADTKTKTTAPPESKGEKISEETTEDDFFGSTNDEEFEEF